MKYMFNAIFCGSVFLTHVVEPEWPVTRFELS